MQNLQAYGVPADPRAIPIRRKDGRCTILHRRDKFIVEKRHDLSDAYQGHGVLSKTVI
jgi:hypothetical protein